MGLIRPPQGRRSIVRLTTQLPAADSSPKDARALLREEFGEKLPADSLYDLLTIVSELVTNAVRHGEGGSIGLAIAVCDDRVRGEVQNRGEGPVEALPVDHSRHGGLGLHIVDAIADRWNVRGDGLTRVSFELSY
jgi:anti-sigma regulatory factor (Ser/Thr protein kinase)